LMEKVHIDHINTNRYSSKVLKHAVVFIEYAKEKVKKLYR